MNELPRFLIAKYVPDVFRNEPRNIGVVLWNSGKVMARFLGEGSGTPGGVNDFEIPEYVNSPEVYKQWVAYWREEIDKPKIRPATGGSWVEKSSPQFLDAFCAPMMSNYFMVQGGEFSERITECRITEALAFLFEEYVEDKRRSLSVLDGVAERAVRDRE